MKWIKSTTKTNSVFQAAGILVIAGFLSRILGFAREIVVTSIYDLDKSTDAYYAAFTIPDFIYYLLVGGALSAAFIPVFSEYVTKEQHEDSTIVVSSILNIVALTAAGLIAIGMIFTPQLVSLLVQFDDPEAIALTVLLTRIMFLQGFFMCLTGISQGVLQCYKHFTSPAMGAIYYNLTIIIVGLLLYKQLGIMAFTIGVVLGAVVNLAVQIPPMLARGFEYRPVIDIHHPGVRKFFALFLPMWLGLGFNELNLVLTNYLGTGLGESVFSALKQAQRIHQLPIGIFAMAIGMSIFPTMTAHVTKGEMTEYRHDLEMGLRTVLFITIPASIGLIVLREPIVRAMYLQGAFTPESVTLIADILAFYCVGIVGYSAQQILNRGFFAVQVTKTPVRINVFVLGFNMVLSIILVRYFAQQGLALAYALSGLLSMVLLMYFLRRKIGSIGGGFILKSAIQSLIAATIMGLAVYASAWGMATVLDVEHAKLAQIIQVCVGIAVGALVYGLTTVAMRMEETKIFFDMVKRKLRR